jgi:beta-galactosidase
MVGPDGEPHPAMWEHQWLGRPARVTATDGDLRKRRVRVHNAQWFVGLGWLRASWELSVDGTVVQSGPLALPEIAPQASAVVDVPFDRPTLRAGEQAHLTVRFGVAKKLPWADRGFELGWDQLALRARPARGASATSPQMKLFEGDAVTLTKDALADRVVIEAGPLHVEVGEGTGTIASLRWHGVDVLGQAPRFELWRAATDNDGMKLFVGEVDKELWVGMAGKPLTRWLDWGLDELHRSPVGASVKRRQRAVVISNRTKAWGSDRSVLITHRQTITVQPTGDLVFDETVRLPDGWDDLPRVGVSFTLPAGFEQLTWFGLGPHENYVDRRSGSTLGRWSSTVAHQYVPYLMPQEHGAHTRVRWAALEQTRPTAGTRVGLLIAGIDVDDLHVTARHHTTDALWRARDWTELTATDDVVVHVDVAQRGLGTGSCGPDTLPRYRVPGGTHRWRWRLRPYLVGVDDPGALGRQPQP